MKYAVLLAACLGLAGCAKVQQTSELLGLSDPSTPPITINIGCDVSSSACSPEHLRAVLPMLLPELSARHGSTLRLFVFGNDLSTTRLLVETRSTPPSNLTSAGVRAHASAFAKATEESFLQAMAGSWSQRRTASPIAEGLSGIATYPATGLTFHVLLTDLRQQSALGSFECAPLPTVDQWQARTKQVLAPVRGTTVLVAFASPFEPVSDGRCKPSMERYQAIVKLWTSALNAHGAQLHVFADGIPQPLSSYLGGAQ